MSYVTHRRGDSRHVTVALLLASVSILATAVVWRRRAAPRTERRVARRVPRRLAPDARPPQTRGNDTQHASSGAGALIHRQYEITLPGTLHDRATLFRLMQAHLTELAPSVLASFRKSEGVEFAVQAGDEYEVTMLGPWNGGVRVAEVTGDSLTLVTLDGHPEAGHITFSVHDGEPAGTHRVLIESWARSRDGLVQAAYNTLGIGRQVQTEVWITFLQRFSTLAGVSVTPEVRITTEELTGDDRTHQRST